MARRVNITLPNPENLVPRVEIRENGNWQKIDVLANELAPSISKGYADETLKFARSIKRIVQRAITSGTPPKNSGITWKPLSPNTIKRHGPHGIYYLTGQYSRAIGIYQYKSRTLVGLPLGIRHSGKGRQLTFNQLAIILEFGTKHIPARPLWRPSLDSYGGLKTLKINLMRSIRRKIINRTGLNANQIRIRW